MARPCIPADSARLAVAALAGVGAVAAADVVAEVRDEEAVSRDGFAVNCSLFLVRNKSRITEVTEGAFL